MPMQNFSSLLGLVPSQQPPPPSQLHAAEQESPNMDALQRVMATLESQGAPVSGAAPNLPPGLFESLFAQALSQSQLPQQSAHQPATHDLSEVNGVGGGAESNTSPPNLTEDAAGGISNVGEDEAAKFMAQLLKGVNPSVQTINSAAQSQPTSPNLDASTLLEQLQFMGLLNPAAAPPSSTAAVAADVQNEWRNNPDLNALFASQGLSTLNGNTNSQVPPSQTRPNDAYCDICDKYLCNRYFLKTHRFKKHGVIDPPSSTTTPSATSTSAVQNFSSPLKRDAEWTREPSTPQRVEGNANMPLANFADPPMKMPRLTAVTDLSGGIKEERSPEKSPDALNRQAAFRHTCDACDKDFDSLPNLFQHQLLHHSTSQAPIGFPNLLQNGGLQNPPPSGQHTPQTPSAHAQQQQTNSPRQPTPASQQHTPVPSSGANVLSQLLPGFQLPGGPFQLPPLFNLANFPSALQFGNELDVARITQQLGNAGNTPTNGTPTAPAVKTPKRQYSSTSKNYCDLCNKEVCNKYFLRTHMLKMHKIVIDENKSVIANIDTLEKEKEGEIWFRCDICRTKLETRQQLREHKRDVHNIAPLAAQTTASAATGGSSSASSECDAGSLRATKTPNSATTDGPNFFSEHPATADDLRTALEIHENTSPSSSASSTAGTAESALLPLGCQFCTEHFANDSKRQEHLLSAHCNELLAQVSKLNSLVVQPTGGNVEDDFVTQVALQMARKNQMGKKSRGEGFVCTSCGRVYSDPNKYADHLNLHAVTKKFVGKKNRRKLQTLKKIHKHRMPFSCTKCQRRFS